MKKYKYIMDSMTDKELEDPKHINSPGLQGCEGLGNKI